MRKALFITPGPIAWASSRMRAHWVAENLPGSNVIEYSKIEKTGKIDLSFDEYVFIKVANDEYVRSLQAAGKRVWWDVCDPVHWFSPDDARRMADAVNGLVFSNENLAEDFAEWYGNIEYSVIKDRIKLDHFELKRTHQPADPVKFIWFGAGQNRNALYGGLAFLERLKANGVNLSLTIMDDRPGEMWIYSGFPIYHISWELDKENQVIAEHDIAILPQYPGPWGGLKSSNRIVTAHACNVPATTADSWEDFWNIATVTSIRAKRAERGLAWVQECYDVRQSAAEWKAIFWP